MREVTYGHYPPAPRQDVWAHYRDPDDTYEYECLYKHQSSRYNNRPGVTTPTPPPHIVNRPSPTPPASATGIRQPPATPISKCYQIQYAQGQKDVSGGNIDLSIQGSKVVTARPPSGAQGGRPCSFKSWSRDNFVEEENKSRSSQFPVRPLRVKSAQGQRSPPASNEKRPVQSAGAPRTPYPPPGLPASYPTPPSTPYRHQIRSTAATPAAVMKDSVSVTHVSKPSSEVGGATRPLGSNRSEYITRVRSARRTPTGDRHNFSSNHPMTPPLTPALATPPPPPQPAAPSMRYQPVAMPAPARPPHHEHRSLVKSASTGDMHRHNPDLIVSYRPMATRPKTAKPPPKPVVTLPVRRAQTPEPQGQATDTFEDSGNVQQGEQDQDHMTVEAEECRDGDEYIGAEVSGSNEQMAGEDGGYASRTCSDTSLVSQQDMGQANDFDRPPKTPTGYPKADTTELYIPSLTDYREKEVREQISGSAKNTYLEKWNREHNPVYEKQINRYGWKAEVPGDPLYLKTPVITKRLPYSVTCSVTTERVPGPKVHMETTDTNFFNTIPRRHATFDVHQDWISEVLHSKRLELQKRQGGIKYTYKNFSFAY